PADANITAASLSGTHTFAVRAVDDAGTVDPTPAIATWTVDNHATAAANDDFADRIRISGASGSIDGTNLGASKEDAEPAHAGNPGGASVWYRWTAAAD